MNQGNNMQGFLKLIISSSEKKATEANMTPEQKKEYINKKLFEYFERNDMRIETILPIYKEVYSEFVQEDFMKYVIEHTSNQDIIFQEKLKVEEKLEKISSRVAQIERLEFGVGISEFDLIFKGIKQDKFSISAKINQIKKKYELPTDTIKPKRGQNISEEQMQEYVDLIVQMVDSSSGVEELYEMAKEQIVFFVGMGDSYEDELRKKSPELFEYIDTLVKDEVRLAMEEEQKLEEEEQKLEEEKRKLEEEKQELKKLEAGFINMCKKYDTRLPENLRGTAEERKQREEIKRRKTQQEAEEKRRREREIEEEGNCSNSDSSGGC